MEKIKILAGNWKMNTNLQEGIELASAINRHMNGIDNTNVKVILAVPFTHLTEMVRLIDNKQILISAQNCASEVSGAFTGEVSVKMLKSVGVNHCIIGHSERRHIFGETNETLKAKVNLCLDNNITPIFCCGETLDVREADNHKALIKEQLEASLFHLSEENIMQSIIAYEPVWAIGTGKTASPRQAQEMHAWIRQLLKEKYSNINVNKIPVLYGGSVKPQNAQELFACPDINGGLVGGASLDKDSFMNIFNAF